MAAGAIVALAAVHDATAQDVTFQARPAAGGLVKAERSAPVRVVVDTKGSLTGEILVTWGDARLRRSIALSTPGRHQFELYVRTGEPESMMRVQLLSRGQVLQTVDMPVRVLPRDEPAALCVRSSSGAAPDASCTATIDPDSLPRSLRGYEAIDAVAWSGGEHGLSVDQRSAIVRWRALRDLERSGDLGLTAQPRRPPLRRGLPEAATRLVALLAAASVVWLAAIGFIATRRRTRLTWSCVPAAVFIASGTVGAHGIGRLGPGAEVAVHHETVLNQVPGTGVSLLAMRGVLEFPAFDHFAVQLSLNDGAIERAVARGRAEEQLDEGGFPVVDGAYGLGSRQAFAAEGVLLTQPLEMTRDGDRVTIVNRSTVAFRDCRFGDGFANTASASLHPGGEVTAQRSFEGPGPIFTCTADAPLVAMTSVGRSVVPVGTTLVAVYGSGRRPPAARTND